MENSCSAMPQTIATMSSGRSDGSSSVASLGIAEQEFSILRNGAQGLAAFSISDVSWTFDKEPRASWMETLAHYMRW